MNDQSDQHKAVRRTTKRRRVEGNDVLYHFLQKTLLESDFAQFRELTSRLITDLGVWLAPSAYQRFPLLVPYALRDPACRGNRSKGIPDEWGSPTAAGYFRDDNSLIKGLPRSLPIRNPSNPLVHGRYVGTSFVASHVWRTLAGGGHASRNASTYSFIPNVVWLPAQISKLTDREGSFVQSYLQALSTRIYREVKLTPKLKAIVTPIWDRLEVRSDVGDVSLPDPSALNFFEAGDDWIRRRARALESVLRGLGEVRARRRPSSKVVSTRYTEGLPLVTQDAVDSLLAKIIAYSEAVEEAASFHTPP